MGMRRNLPVLMCLLAPDCAVVGSGPAESRARAMSVAQRGAGPAAGMPPGPPMPSNPAERYPHPEATWRHRPSRTVEEGFSLIADGGDGCEDVVDPARSPCCVVWQGV